MRLAVIGFRGFPGIQGGVESHCENIIPRLDSDIQCTVYRRKPFLGTTSKPTTDGIKFIDLPSTRIKGFEALFHTFISCLHIILKRNADVVNIHNIGPGLFTPLLRLFRFKVVLTYHSPNYEHAKWGFFAKTILKAGEFFALHCANRVIFVNKFQMAKYSEKIMARSTFIPNGINPVSLSTNTDFLDKHRITPDNYILAVGRLTPEKGFDSLIKAVNKSNVSTLVIAGSADHNPEYADYLKNLDINNRTIFTGYTTGEDLRQLYSHARLFALSSRNEGFPIVLLEALSYGLPVSVTDIPATHLLDLQEDSYMTVDDIDDMAQCINTKFNKSLNHKTPYDFLLDYDWNNIANLTSHVYLSLK